jgi:hypothetical protein
MDAITLVDPLGLGRRAWRLSEGRRTAARGAAEDALLGALDHVLHRAIQRGLVQTVVDELLAEGVVDQVAERVLSGPELDRVAERVLDSAGTERLVAQVLASRELWVLVDEIARSPSVTEAISHQGAGFADQVVGEVGEGTRRADAWLERAARRMLGRTPEVSAPPLAP